MTSDQATYFIAGVRAARYVTIEGASPDDIAQWLKGLEVWLHNDPLNHAPTVWQSVRTERLRADTIKKLGEVGRA